MPELPEVETVRRGLNQVTLNQPVLGGEVLLERTIAYPTAAEFLAALAGTTIAQWQRRGKYLLAELRWKSGETGYLGIHLRMTGQLLWVAQSEPMQKHCRVRLLFPERRELVCRSAHVWADVGSAAWKAAGSDRFGAGKLRS